MTRKLIYIASPLFSDAERNANEAMTAILEQWFDVFLPQRDGSLISDLVAQGMNASEAYSHVFLNDIEAISKSDAIIINLDGRSVDEGAAFELGFAFARAKVCVGYRTDVRVLLPWGLNPMVTVPLQTILRSPEELEQWSAMFAVSKIRRVATG